MTAPKRSETVPPKKFCDAVDEAYGYPQNAAFHRQAWKRMRFVEGWRAARHGARSWRIQVHPNDDTTCANYRCRRSHEYVDVVER
jgi:hypothetical protein